MRGVVAVGPPSLAVSTSALAWRPTTSGHRAVLGGFRFFQRTATTTTTRQQLSHSRFFTSAFVGFDFAGKKKKKKKTKTKNRRSKEEEDEEEEEDGEGEEEVFRVPDSFIQRHGLRDSSHFVSGWKFLSNFDKYEKQKKKEEEEEAKKQKSIDEEAEAEEQEDEGDDGSNKRRQLDKEKKRERRSSRAKEHLLLLPFDKEKGTLTLTVARGGEEKERLRLDAFLVSTLNPSHEDEEGEEGEEKEKREIKGEKEVAAGVDGHDRGSLSRRSVKRKKLEKKKRGKYKANEEEAVQEESAEEEEEDQPMSMNERRNYYMDLLMEKPTKANTEEDDGEEENEEETEDKRLLSRTTIQRSIKEGNVRVNGVVVKKANHKLAKDDVVVWELDEQQRLSFEDLLNREEQKSPNNKKEKRKLQEEEEEANIEEEMKAIEEDMFVQFVPEDIPLAVVHEDEDLVVLNKAAGMPVQPSPGKTKGTLVNALLHHYAREGLSTVDGPLRPGIVHRLDKDTSGLMVIAKTNDAHQHLKQQFRNRSIMKRYKAIVVGRPQTSDEGDENETTVIRKRIERHPRLIQKMQVVNEKEAECERGKDAITEFSVLDSWRWSNVSLSLLDVQIHTGRMHQIRVHLSSIGHPIVGDKLYANKQSKKVGMSTQTKEEQKQQGQLLLASTALSMVHPRTGQRMNFEVSLPPHMSDFIRVTKASS